MILITGGGTGGHLAIARALKKEFVQRGKSVIYIGSSQGQDRAWFERDLDFYAKFFLPSSGVVDKRGVRKLLALTTILKESFKAASIIKKYRVQAVISVGGYSAAAASFGALLTQKPLFIHEQNAHIGRLNKILKPFSKRFFCSFFPPYDPYPVNEIFYQTRRVRKELKTIIFLGGSQGSLQINELAFSLAPILQKKGVKIIHQCGKRGFEEAQHFYQANNIDVELFDFDPNLITKISHADLAISRAGASTLWELCANGLPALLLPYPYAANDHQRKNALFFQERGGMKLYEESIDIFNLDLERMSRALHTLFQPEGASEIVEEILKTI